MSPRTMWTPLGCAAVGLVLMCSGALLAAFWTRIHDHVMAKNLALTPDSQSYKMLKDPPVPISTAFYFFNWTNPEDILDPTKKPKFVEMGPYRFIEVKDKSDIAWNSNNTISFRQKRFWYYTPEDGSQSLDDELTTVNVVALTFAYGARHWSYFKTIPLRQMLKGQSITRTHTVREYLFDGFDDPLLTIGKLGSLFTADVEVPFNKFAWFYERNGTTAFDGYINMNTGVEDVTRLGSLAQWNYRNSTGYFPGTCGQLSGSTGELFPPDRKKNESIGIFSTDLCRTMTFDYQDEVSVEQLAGYRYTAGASNLDNGTLDPSNKCYCGGNCVPSGVVNASTCRYGAPGFVSYPHFYQADPYYLDRVDGLAPDADKHGSQVILEPTTGLAIDAKMRLQVNILMQPYKSISMLANLPTVFFPMWWCEQKATITPDLATMLHRLIGLSTLAFIASFAAFAVGLVIIAATAFFYWWNIQKHKLPEKSDNIHELQNHKNIDVLNPLMMRPSLPTMVVSGNSGGCSDKVGINAARRPLMCDSGAI